MTAGTPVGSTVHSWIDSAGHVTPPPLTDSDAVTRAMSRAVLTVVPVTIGAFAAFGTARRAINRSPAPRWASEGRRRTAVDASSLVSGRMREVDGG